MRIDFENKKKLSRCKLLNFAFALILFGLITATPCFAINPNQLTILGSTINYLGKTYDQNNDRTHFIYRINRPLLGLPIQLLKFILPDCITAHSLIDVRAAGSANLLNLLADQNAFELKSLNLLALSTDIDITVLGNAGEGLINIQAALNLGNSLTSGTITGPLVDANVNINIGNIFNCNPNPTATATAVPTATLVATPTTPNNPTPHTTPTPINTPTPPSTPTAIPSPTQQSHPTCLLDSLNPVVAKVGELLNLNVQLNDTASGPLEVQYGNFPLGAILSIPSGSTINPGQILSLNWIPKAADANSNQLIRLNVKSNLLSNLICDINVNVIDDLPPVINLKPIPNPIPCNGALTPVLLDASASYDPEGHPLTFTWSHTCQNGAIDNSSIAQTLLRLSLPGSGNAQNCLANLVVSDGTKTAQISVALGANACTIDPVDPVDPVTCPTNDVDQCGVCHGNNACLDCAGQPNGTQIVDRCGVCGGNNACVDCNGVAFGSSTKDNCGVCNGNGTSCRNCAEVDLRGALATLDNTARAQANLTVDAVKKLNKTSFAKEAKKLTTAANGLYTKSWTLIWSLSQKDVVCSDANYVNCTSASSVNTFSIYQQNTIELKKLALKASKLLKKVGGKSNISKAARLVKETKSTLFDTSAKVNSYPQSTSNCG